jgi:hypothetical protein
MRLLRLLRVSNKNFSSLTHCNEKDLAAIPAKSLSIIAVKKFFPKSLLFLLFHTGAGEKGEKGEF